MKGNICIVCRTLGRKCGIGEHSRHLANSISALAVPAASEVPPECEIVFIQYEPALYHTTEEVISEIELLKGKTVVLDCHNITEKAYNKLKWNAIIATKTGKIPNTYQLNLVIPSLPVSQTNNREDDRLMLGSFGFAFPHKNYHKIVELGRRLRVKVKILAAPNDSNAYALESSTAYLNKLRKLRDENFILIDQFLPESDVIKELQECSHLIVACSDVEHWPTSAAIRMMALAGRPIIAVRSQAAEDANAVMVNGLEEITIDFLRKYSNVSCKPYDGLQDYMTLIDKLIRMRDLSARIGHDDRIYDESLQRERVVWMRDHVIGKAIDIGIGNGYTTNFIRAEMGIEIREDRLEYARLRYPHIRFEKLDARKEAVIGFDTVVLAEIIEHMSIGEAREMVALWAKTSPTRILLTTPNAEKPNYNEEIIFSSEHMWLPTEETILSIVPEGYKASIFKSKNEDFFFVVLDNIMQDHSGYRVKAPGRLTTVFMQFNNSTKFRLLKLRHRFHKLKTMLFKKLPLLLPPGTRRWKAYWAVKQLVKKCIR
jgi:hypothetical protein